VTVGVLSLTEIGNAQDFALAEAARPRFGQAGFTIIAIAAVLSTASAINATLYGATRLTFGVARSGELPELLSRRLAGGIAEGLVVTSCVTLVIANTFDLSRISTLGSAGFLLIFGAVNLAQLRLRTTEQSAWLPALGLAGCTVALVALFAQSGADDPIAIVFAVGLIIVSFASEATYRRLSPGRTTLRDRHGRRDSE
jgi:hypothetical protein